MKVKVANLSDFYQIVKSLPVVIAIAQFISIIR